jgi:hypothetical protein
MSRHLIEDILTTYTKPQGLLEDPDAVPNIAEVT